MIMQYDDSHLSLLHLGLPTPTLSLTHLQPPSLTQLFEVIQPGSEGVLIDTDKISKAALRKGAMFLTDLFNYQTNPEDNLKPPEESSRGSGGASGSEQEGKHSQQNRDEL